MELQSVQSTVRELDARLDAALEATRRWKSRSGSVGQLDNTASSVSSNDASVDHGASSSARGMFFHNTINTTSNGNNSSSHHDQHHHSNNGSTAATSRTNSPPPPPHNNNPPPQDGRMVLIVESVMQLLGLPPNVEANDMEMAVERLRAHTQERSRHDAILRTLEMEVQKSREIMTEKAALQERVAILTQQLSDSNDMLLQMHNQVEDAKKNARSSHDDSEEQWQRAVDNGKAVVHALEAERGRLAAKVVQLEKALAAQTTETRENERRLQALSAQVSQVLAQKRTIEVRCEEMSTQLQSFRIDHQCTLRALAEAQAELARAYEDADQLQAHYDDKIAAIEERMIAERKRTSDAQRRIRETVDVIGTSNLPTTTTPTTASTNHVSSTSRTATTTRTPIATKAPTTRRSARG